MKSICLEIENIKISLISENKNNSKLHPKSQIEKIKNSIDAFGFNDPIAVDEQFMIIEGHGRFKAAKELGMEVVPIIQLSHLSELEKKQYILAHNKLTLETGFDEELLRIELERIAELGGDLDLTGFDAIELEELQIETEDILEEHEIPALEETTFSKTGDLWVLGDHKLLVGDVTDEENINKLLGDKKVDLVVTDPPYNINYSGKGTKKLKIENDDMPDSEFYEFLLKSFKNMNQVMKPGAMIYVFYADKEAINFRNAFKNAELYNSQTCIWLKNGFNLGRFNYHYQHEPIIVGWKEGQSHKFYGDRKQTTIFEFNKPLKNDEHPTMKPIDLLEYIIKNSSKKGNYIFDGFGGSGSTLIAAEHSKRRALLLEIDARYADVIVKRYANLGKMDIKVIRDGQEYSYSEILEMG